MVAAEGAGGADREFYIARFAGGGTVDASWSDDGVVRLDHGTGLPLNFWATGMLPRNGRDDG